jgi:ATP-dependent Zn protease
MQTDPLKKRLYCQTTDSKTTNSKPTDIKPDDSKPTPSRSVFTAKRPTVKRPTVNRPTVKLPKSKFSSNMNTKTKLTICILLVILIIGGVFYLFINRNASPVSSQKLAQVFSQAPEIKKEYTLDQATIKIPPKDQNSVGVVLGDASSKEFVPDLEINRWDGEVKFTLKPDVSNIPDSEKKVTLDGEKINYETPQVTYQFNNKPDASD